MSSNSFSWGLKQWWNGHKKATSIIHGISVLSGAGRDLLDWLTELETGWSRNGRLQRERQRIWQLLNSRSWMGRLSKRNRWCFLHPRPRSALGSRWFESFWETQEAGIWCPWKVTWQWTNSLGRGHVLRMTPLLPLVFSTHPPACWMVLYIFRAIPMLPRVSVISGNAHKGMLLVC